MYYYPNRPILIPPDPNNPMRPKPDYINSLETQGRWIAEQKWNGDNCLVYTGKKPEFWNRYKARLRYQPSEEVFNELKRWPANSVLNVELVHNKTKTVKNLLIVHCVMKWDGEWLFGKTWGDSRKILKKNNKLSGSHVKISPVWKSGFWDLFQQADGSIVEGIIIKDPKGKLLFSATPVKDVPWMRKIRKPSKKYNF